MKLKSDGPNILFFLALEIIIDLPIGFPINNIISLCFGGQNSIDRLAPKRLCVFLCFIEPMLRNRYSAKVSARCPGTLQFRVSLISFILKSDLGPRCLLSASECGWIYLDPFSLPPHLFDHKGTGYPLRSVIPSFPGGRLSGF